MKSVVFGLIATNAMFHGFVFSDVLNLSLPNYTIDGENIWVKCSSDRVPYEQIAEFLVNGVTADIIRRHNNRCFSSITRQVCTSDICYCSTDGKSYSTKLFANNQIGNVTITCAMKFKRNKEVFKSGHVYISIIESTTHKEYKLSSVQAKVHHQLSTERFTTGGTTGDRISPDYWNFSNVLLETDKIQVSNSETEKFLYGFLAVSFILGVCFLSIPVVWMILRYRSNNLERQRDVVQFDKTSQKTDVLPSTNGVFDDIDFSDYESINDSDVVDSEMLVNISRMYNRDQITTNLTANSSKYNTVKSYYPRATLDSSQSDSICSKDHSYLEVIADTEYLNSYEIIEANEYKLDNHTYCLTLKEGFHCCNIVGKDTIQKLQYGRVKAKQISLSLNSLVKQSALNNINRSYSDGNINSHFQNEKKMSNLHDAFHKQNQIPANSKSKNRDIAKINDNNLKYAASIIGNSKTDLSCSKMSSKMAMNTFL